MLVKITHITNLAYDDLISESAMELRMSPRQEDDQHRLSFTLAVGPATPVASYFDWLGNTVHALTINGFHREMRVVATSVVEINRDTPMLDGGSDVWPIAETSLNYDMYDYLQFAGPIIGSASLARLAEGVAAKRGEPLSTVCMRVMELVHDRFMYQKGVTTAASPITDILEKGGGV